MLTVLGITMPYLTLSGARTIIQEYVHEQKGNEGWRECVCEGGEGVILLKVTKKSELS